MREQELLSLLRSDPEQGLHALMEQYGGALQTICKNFLYDCPVHDVEEAVADTFINFWKNQEKYRPDEKHSLRSYIYAIARNAARDKRRRQKKAEIFSIEELSLDLPDEISLESDFVRKQNEEILHETLRNMTEPDRSIFLYRYFYGFSVREIAEKMELKEKKVENILYRGKEKLRVALLRGGISRD